MLDLLLELGRVAELDPLPVDDRAGVAGRRELLEEVDELALLLGDDGREDLEPGAGLELHELVGDLLHGLLADDLAARRAVRDPDARPEQTHVVVDLGDRADGRPRVAVGRLLVDRHRGRQPLDEVDVGAVDLAEELARVGGQGLDVAALPLGEDRVERQRGLARAGQAGEHDERVAGDLEVDVRRLCTRAPRTLSVEVLCGAVPPGRWRSSRARRRRSGPTVAVAAVRGDGHRRRFYETASDIRPRWRVRRVRRERTRPRMHARWPPRAALPRSGRAPVVRPRPPRPRRAAASSPAGPQYSPERTSAPTAACTSGCGAGVLALGDEPLCRAGPRGFGS